MFPRAIEHFHHHQLHPASAGRKQVAQSKGFFSSLSLVLDPQERPGTVEAPPKCSQWKYTASASPKYRLWVVALIQAWDSVLENPSWPLKLVSFGTSSKQPPVTSLCVWEGYSSPGCAGGGTNAAASRLHCNVFLPKHCSYCSVGDFFFCCRRNF